MSLSHKLRDWKAAGLIDDLTAARIEAFERRARRPFMLYTLGALGALTIGIGIVAVVAANWDGIPAAAKLAVDIFIACGLAAGTFLMTQRREHWLIDVLVVIYYLFTLASLALLGQIYHSAIPTYQALLLWSAVTLPLMWLGQNRLLGFIWAVGLAITEATAVIGGLDYLDQVLQVQARHLVNLGVSVAFVSPLAFVVAGHLLSLRQPRDQVGAAFRDLGWSGLLVGGIVLPFAWYGGVPASVRLSWAIAVCTLAAAVFIGALRLLYPTIRSAAWAGVALFCGLLVGTLAAASAVERAAWPSVGALTQTVVLVVVAFVAAQVGQLRAFHVLTALASLRILSMYFEIFGSMLSTGLGMIIGGALTLLLAWVWKRASPALARRLSAAEG